MSLPQANKSIANPGKNTVTEPTVQEVVEKDVDRKMRMYGIIQAFRKGRMPDNQQIDETLCWIRDHSPIDETKLSTEGRRLISDVREIIETSRLIVKEKNSDEVFQNFVYHTNGTQFKDKAMATRSESESSAVVDKDGMTKDGRQAVEHIRTLFNLLVTNSEARKLLQDMSIIGRDLFAQTAGYAADRVRPPAEALARVDDAAPSHSWVGPGQPVPGTGVGVAQPQYGATTQPQYGATTQPQYGATTQPQYGTTAQPMPNTLPTTGATSVPRATTSTLGSAPGSSPKTKTRADEVIDKHAGPIQESDSPTTATKKGIMSRFQNTRDKVPEKHRQVVSDEVDHAKNFLKDEFPKERRDQFVWRLKKVVVECQSHSDYQGAVTWFLTTIENYFSKARDVGSTEGKKTTSALFDDPQVQRAWDELRLLLERFANGVSMDRMINAAQRLADDTRQDQELRAWWSQVDGFIRQSLLEPGFILSPKFSSTSENLQDQSRQFFDVKYKGHRDEFFDAVQEWFTAWADDRLNKRFGDDWTRLTRDLLFNEKGDLELKPELWHDIRTVILPTLAKQVGYVPIPRIEYTDKALDLVIENLTLQGKNIFPNIIEATAQNYIKLSPYASIQDESHHTLTLNLSQIHADLRDVAFYFRRKSGLPKIKDSGLADVFIGGNGISVKVKIVSTTGPAGKRENMGNSIFKVKEVNVKVDSLKFSIRDSKHDLLYKTLRPLATGLIKKQISKAFADGITTALEYLDAQLVQARARMSEDNTSNTQVLKEFFSKSTSTQPSNAPDASAAQKAAAVKEKRESKFNFVPRRESLLLPEVGHEKGWINKQNERDDLAEAGDGWKSKAFTIVPGTVPTTA